jgi:hypothetical protein
MKPSIQSDARHRTKAGNKSHSLRRKKSASDRVTLRRVGRLAVRLIRGACWIAGGIGIACGLYMTLRPSSMLSEIPWLPHNIAVWADNYGRFRNFPAYAVLAMPFMIIANGRRARLRALMWLGIFGAAVEAAQYLIPTRWCEWQDVAWSWMGLVATWLLAEFSYKVAWKIRCALKKKSDPERVSRVLKAVLPTLSENGKS